MKILRRLLTLALLIGGLVLGYRLAQANGSPVALDLLYTTLPELPQWMVVGASFLLGAGVAALLMFYQLAKLGLVTRRYRKTVRGLESEVHQLRNLPLAGGEGAGSTAAGAGVGAERGSAPGTSV